MGKNEVEVILFNGKRWLNGKHIEIQLKLSNLVAITNKYPPKLRKKDKNCKIVGIISLVEDV